MLEEIVVVVSGGNPPASHAASHVPIGAPVIAADRGLDHALALGLDVTVAVGDFDSVTTEALAAAEQAGVRIERHPPDKDATDLELALDAAIGMAPERILVLAGAGGRLDHELSALLVLASDRYAAEVRNDYAEGRALGIQGVPFFVIDRRYGISGAQPTELFVQALTQAKAEAEASRA